jgi:hypothetical protein
MLVLQWDDKHHIASHSQKHSLFLTFSSLTSPTLANYSLYHSIFQFHSSHLLPIIFPPHEKNPMQVGDELRAIKINITDLQPSAALRVHAKTKNYASHCGSVSGWTGVPENRRFSTEKVQNARNSRPE